jgi:hypothetical protein
MKKFRGVFAKFWGSSNFQDLWIYFPKDNSIEYVHGTVDRVHRLWLTGLWTSLNAGRWLPDRWLGLNQPIRLLRRLALAGGGAGSRSWRCAMVERGSSPEFEFSRATLACFRWNLLWRDHNAEGILIMLTLIGGERQRSPATVRRLGRCLAMVRAASGEVSAPRTCAEASSSSLLASRPINCSERRWKTRIWWLPRVGRVLDLWPKNSH